MQTNYHHIYETLNQGIPIVMFDRIIDKISCDKVTIDDKKAHKMRLIN